MSSSDGLYGRWDPEYVAVGGGRRLGAIAHGGPDESRYGVPDSDGLSPTEKGPLPAQSEGRRGGRSSLEPLTDAIASPSALRPDRAPKRTALGSRKTPSRWSLCFLISLLVSWRSAYKYNIHLTPNLAAASAPGELLLLGHGFFEAGGLVERTP